MIYGTLKTAVKANLNGRDDDDTLTLIMSKTNFLIEWLATQKEWEDLQDIATGVSMVVGTYVYSLATLGLTTKDRILSFKFNNGTRWLELTPVTRTVWNREYAPYIGITTGQPSVHCSYAGNIYLSNTPDDTYAMEIDYYKQPTKVTGDNSVIPFSNMDGLFESLVTGLTWLGLGEMNLSDRWLKIALPMVESFGLDSGRLLGGHNPNKLPQTQTTPWNDPFRRK